MTTELFREGRIWHYRFRVDGVRTQRTTRQTNKRIAQEIANKAHAEAKARANGMQAIPTVLQLITRWKEVRGPLASDSHRSSMDLLARRHLYGLGDMPISKLSTEVIERARNAHLAGRSRSSGNHWLRYMKLLVNWAVRQKIIPELPWKVPQLTVQKKVRHTLPLKKTVAWFAAIDRSVRRGSSVPTAVRLMYGLGLRESEAGGARWEWVDWERGTYTPGITKGKEAVAVSMPTWLKDYLRPLRRKSGLIAPRKHGQQLPVGYARRAMARANKTTGLMGITPHRLRGTFATLLSEEHVPVQTIKAMLRHKDANTTMAYLEVNLEVGAQAQDRIGMASGLDGRKIAGHRRARPHAR
jgi:integrase